MFRNGKDVNSLKKVMFKMIQYIQVEKKICVRV